MPNLYMMSVLPTGGVVRGQRRGVDNELVGRRTAAERQTLLGHAAYSVEVRWEARLLESKKTARAGAEVLHQGRHRPNKCGQLRVQN